MKFSAATICAILAALVAALAITVITWYQLTQLAVVPNKNSSTNFQPLVEVGGPFVLVDHSGSEVTDLDYRGEFLVIYFGYTDCPDICPTALQNISIALDELGGKAKFVRPLFITVDPKRDTVETLAQYVIHFHPKLIGLTGTKAQIEQVSRLYRVFYAKVNDPQATEYLMDHSSFIYLMGRDGEFLTMFPPQTNPSSLAETISAYINQAI